jgi:hypothetical protein
MTHSHRFPFANPYQCRDCGSEAGFRSRPRTLAERYILPLFLMHPVRCADCFRRDYRLIFTPVLDGSETVRKDSRNPKYSVVHPTLKNYR